MFGVIFKTLNAKTKLSKTIINGPTKYTESPVQDQHNYINSIPQNYMKININQINIKDNNNILSKNSKQELLSQLEIERQFFYNNNQSNDTDNQIQQITSVKNNKKFKFMNFNKQSDTDQAKSDTDQAKSDTDQANKLNNQNNNNTISNYNTHHVENDNITSQKIPKSEQFNQFIHSLSSIKSLQFQANNPIQDRIVNSKLSIENTICMNIFDGHGGYKLSQYASKKIVQFIQNYLEMNIQEYQEQFKYNQNSHNDDDNKYEQLLKKSILYAYQQIQQSFYQILQCQYKTGNTSLLKSGTCAHTIILYNNIIITANLGDSQAILITQNGQNQVDYLQCNQLLSLKNEQQKSRLIKQFINKDKDILIKNKKQQYYIKGLLQPTYTLGDYYLKKQQQYMKIYNMNNNNMSNNKFNGPYIKNVPVISTIKINSQVKYLIMASDGLWDFVNKQEILSIGKEFMDKQKKQLKMIKKHNEKQQQSSQQNIKIGSKMIKYNHKQNTGQSEYRYENINSQLQQPSQQIDFLDLNKAYVNIQKQPNSSLNHTKQHQTRQLHQILKEKILTNCQKLRGLSQGQIYKIQPGKRRKYCDDISIITYKF